MSTRCLYGFKKDNILKLAYNHSDSYPTGWGKDIMLFIRENTIKELNEIADKIRIVNRKEMPTDSDITEMIEKKINYRDKENILCWDDIFWSNYTILDYYKDDFYVMPDYSDCIKGVQDYLYIINLDKNSFDVYYMRHSDEPKDPSSEFEDYKLLKSFDLENIPRNWDRML